MDYYIHKNDQQLGPFSKREIFDQVLSGKISEEDYFWCDGMETWAPLKNLQLTSHTSWNEEESSYVPEYVSKRMREATEATEKKVTQKYSLPVRIFSTFMGLLVLSVICFTCYLKWSRRLDRVEHLIHPESKSSEHENSN